MTNPNQQEEIIQAGLLVESTLATDGWVNYIAPLLDKMITDILGGKQDGRWISAPHSVGEGNINVDYLRFLLGYKAALIDFHARVFKLIDDKDEVLAQEANPPKNYVSDYEPEK